MADAMKLVPCEPTEAMIEAGIARAGYSQYGPVIPTSMLPDLYRAMLAASPPAPEEAPAEGAGSMDEESVRKIIRDGMVEFSNRKKPSGSNAAQAASSFSDSMADRILSLRPSPVVFGVCHDQSRYLLWMLHLRGPDDIYPAVNYETAVEWADRANALVPECRAVPSLWTGSHESHARGLAKAISDWELTDPKAALRNRTSEPEAGEDEQTYYGKDCPVGMVQVEFVGCPPSERYSDYGWKPTKSAFIELYVDGERYRIDAGEIGQNCFDGKPRRGIHINYPVGAELGDRSVNALSLSNPGSVPFWSAAPATADKLRVAKEALEFYADRERWEKHETDVERAIYNRQEGSEFGSDDQGERARQALAAMNEQPQ